MKDEKSKINLKSKIKLRKPSGEIQDYIIEFCEVEIINSSEKNKFSLNLLISLISVCVAFVLGIAGQLYSEKLKESRQTPQLGMKYVLEKISRQEEQNVEIVKGVTSFFNPEENRLVRSSFLHLIIVKNNSSTARATNVKLRVKVSPPARIYAIAGEEYKPNPLCGSNSTEALIELKDLERKKEVSILLGVAFPGSKTSSLEKKGKISIFLESENGGLYNDTIALFPKPE